MKKLFRIVVVVSVFLAVLAAAGCGKEEQPEPEAQPESKVEIAGVKKNWGSFQVFVPEGMTLTGGSLIDIEDPDSLWIQPEEFGLECFKIVKVDKATVDADIEEAKNSYSTTDISGFSAGAMSWSGISYKSGNQTVQILKGNKAGNYLEVLINGYEYDSDLSMAVLEGIQILQ